MTGYLCPHLRSVPRGPFTPDSLEASAHLLKLDVEPALFAAQLAVIEAKGEVATSRLADNVRAGRYEAPRDKALSIRDSVVYCQN